MRLTIHLRCIMKEIGELTKQYSNLPERYIKRVSELAEYRTPNRIQYLPDRVDKPRRYRFSTHRPWTDEFKRDNRGFVPPILVEPIKEWLIFRGDRVEILAGPDKGKQGIVNQVHQERNWVIVAGLNWVYKKIGETDKYPGMLIRDEQPLLVTTQVSLVDPSDKKCTKAEWRYTEDGEKVRVSLRTGRIIPMPIMAEETIDYKTKATYLENEKKDTKAKDVEQPTFEPKLKTFEMEIMESMGIVEDRVPKKSYWY